MRESSSSSVFEFVAVFFNLFELERIRKREKLESTDKRKSVKDIKQMMNDKAEEKCKIKDNKYKKFKKDAEKDETPTLLIQLLLLSRRPLLCRSVC